MTKLFLGGTVSSGRQWVSWIHFEDFLRVVDFLIERESMSGVVHITSPNPVNNRELMASLRKTLNRPWTPPTPALLVKVGAWLLFRTDPALALLGRRAIPKRLQDAGFEFRFSHISASLSDLCREDVRPEQM
jgi:NAD dependent epimerase/dehydratase family enzyme